MRIIQLMLFFFVYSSSLAQGSGGSIAGRVLSPEGELLVGVYISIEGASLNTVTQGNGSFYLKDVPAGKQILILQSLGYQTRRAEVNVVSGIQNNIDIKLDISSNELQEVIIVGEKANALSEPVTSAAGKQSLPIMQIPQVVSVVNQKLINDQLIVDFQNVLRNTVGVQPTYSGASYQMVQKSRGFEFRNYFRNGLPYPFNGVRDVANIERVEVLRGPNGTLYGGSNMNSPAGLINITTKKPTETFQASAGVTVGSFGFFRPTLDIGGPISENSKVSYRLNVSQESVNGFKDFYERKSTFIAPVVSYKINDDTELLFDAEFFTMRDNDVQLPEPSGELLKDIPVGLSIVPNQPFSELTSSVFQTTLKHRFNNTWNSNTNFTYVNFDREEVGAYGYMINETEAARYTYARATNKYAYSLQQNFLGNFQTGSISHRLITGFDLFYNKEDFRDGLDFNGDVVDIRSNIFPAVPQAEYDTAKAYNFRVRKGAGTQSAGVYVQDVVTFNSWLTLLGGLRYDVFSQSKEQDLLSGQVADEPFDQNVFAPRLGIVFQPLPEVLSIFGNYATGSEYVGGRGEDGNRFKPQQYQQLEGGIRMQLLQKRIMATVAYYDIEVSNILMPGSNPLFSIQKGTQRSKGVEFEVVANPFQGLNILAGYANNDNKITKASPAVEGKSPNGIPKTSANWWVSYEFMNGKAKGLGLGVGGFRMDDVFLLPNNVVAVPGYTIWNASLFYTIGQVRLTLKADNLANENYYMATYGNVDFGMPRRFLLSARFTIAAGK